MTDDLLSFLLKVGACLSFDYDRFHGWTNFNVEDYAKKHRLMICYRDQKPVGICMSKIISNTFDSGVKILYQDLLYSEPGSRAAYLLMRDFIDFGKSNAKYIVTMIAAHTNIKKRSLERLGFKALEEQYIIEV